MTRTQAQRQIHGLRLVAPKATIARVINLAEKNGGVSNFTALRGRTAEEYAELRKALEESR